MGKFSHYQVRRQVRRHCMVSCGGGEMQFLFWRILTCLFLLAPTVISPKKGKESSWYRSLEGEKGATSTSSRSREHGSSFSFPITGSGRSSGEKSEKSSLSSTSHLPTRSPS